MRPATWNAVASLAWPDRADRAARHPARRYACRVSDKRTDLEDADQGPPAAVSPRAGDLLATAVAAFDRLGELGETVEDEWTYVTKLVAVGRGRLRAAVPDAGGPVSPEQAAAIDALGAESGRITDPHRAIDWLSTLPAVAELVLGGEALDRPSSGGA
jgi:hypothetical protein